MGPSHLSRDRPRKGVQIDIPASLKKQNMREASALVRPKSVACKRPPLQSCVLSWETLDRPPATHSRSDRSSGCQWAAGVLGARLWRDVDVDTLYGGRSVDRSPKTVGVLGNMSSIGLATLCFELELVLPESLSKDVTMLMCWSRLGWGCALSSLHQVGGVLTHGRAWAGSLDREVASWVAAFADAWASAATHPAPGRGRPRAVHVLSQLGFARPVHPRGLPMRSSGIDSGNSQSECEKKINVGACWAGPGPNASQALCSPVGPNIRNEPAPGLRHFRATPRRPQVAGY